MGGAEALDLARESMWVLVLLTGPVMMVGLVVGLAVGLLQALTQIQEATIVFVPKIVAVFAALLIFLPLMGALLAGFAEQVFNRIAEF